MEVVLGACTWEQNEPAKAMGGSFSHKGKEPWFHGVGGRRCIGCLNTFLGWQGDGRLGSVLLVWPMGDLAGWGDFPAQWVANLVRAEELMVWLLGPCET